MTITWKQIDTNGNGYVDGIETISAQAKGVKNVWNEMTEQDFDNNITRQEKIKNILKNTYNIDEGGIFSTCNMGNLIELENQQWYNKQLTKEQLENKLLEYQRKLDAKKEEFKQLGSKLGTRFKIAYAFKRIEGCGKIPYTTNQNVLKYDELRKEISSIRDIMAGIKYYIKPTANEILQSLNVW